MDFSTKGGLSYTHGPNSTLLVHLGQAPNLLILRNPNIPNKIAIGTLNAYTKCVRRNNP
jgi:hypothetical protein